MSGSTNKDKSLFDTLLSRDPWKVIVTGATTFAAVCSLGFGAGMKYAESQANVKLAELNGTVGQAQAKLESAQGKVEQLKELRQSDLEKLAQRDKEIARLTSQVGRSVGCKLLEREIAETRAEIRASYDRYLGARGEANIEQARVKRAAMDGRLENLQRQLGSCSK